jgi:hypothetical protein
MVEYGINQKRLSEKIDAEFYTMRKAIQIAYYNGTKGYTKGITVASLHPCDTPRIDSVVSTILKDIDTFQIKSPATYAKTILCRSGIYGFGICAKGDEYDRDFGELVAKARLLKHLKKSGLINNKTKIDKCEYYNNGFCIQYSGDCKYRSEEQRCSMDR